MQTVKMSEELSKNQAADSERFGNKRFPVGNQTERHSESEDEEPELEENEPYLGPAWAAAMLVLYLLKQAFPAEQFTALWWFQVYVIGLVIAITAFTLIKRHQFYRAERNRNEDK